MPEQRKSYSTAQREKLASEGKALSDGSYPIADSADLKNAATLAASGHGNVSAAKALIRKRAKELGVDVSSLPGFGEKKALQVGDDVEDRQHEEPDADDFGGPSDNDADDCPTCDGTGMVDGETCPDCEGSGKASEMTGADSVSSSGGQQNAENPELEQRKVRAELLTGSPLHRAFDADMELRATTDEGVLHLTGYASTTETPYDVQDFKETIARGAFKRTLGEEPDVVLLVNHDGIPLARTKSGTLTLSEDTRGLRVDADLDAQNPLVQSLVSPMQRGDLTEMSFAFRATNDEWDEEYTERTIREVSIHRGDVSMVTHGANSATIGSVSIRSEEKAEEESKPAHTAAEVRSYLQTAKAKRAKLRRKP